MNIIFLSFFQALGKADVATKWAATSWAKKLASKAKRATLGDFDRFKVKVNKQKKARIVNTEFNKLKSASKAAPVKTKAAVKKSAVKK